MPEYKRIVIELDRNISSEEKSVIIEINRHFTKDSIYLEYDENEIIANLKILDLEKFKNKINKITDKYHLFPQNPFINLLQKIEDIESVGIDTSIKHFLATSDEIQVEPLNILRKKEKKLKREYRGLSRKRKESENRKKQIVKLRKVYQCGRDARTDFNHKGSIEIAKHYGTVVVEDLNTQGLVWNHNLAKSITDQGWYQFKKMFEHKLQWRDGELIEIGWFDPSSKTCSRCGNIKHDLKLSDRIYHCDVCGLTIDRNLNAVSNIRNMGLVVWLTG